MSPRELVFIKAILKRATFKDCLEWASFGFVTGGMAEPGAAPHGGPATPVGSSPVSEEPPPAS